MEFVVFQDIAKSTFLRNENNSYKEELSRLIHGLTEESGEVAGKFKKFLRGDYKETEELRMNIMKELGDVLWYCAVICDFMEISLDDVAKMNQIKLLDRKNNNTIKGSGDVR